jgi:hypothetical protein
MPEADKAAKLKALKQARDQVLKEYDISFGINGEVLSNILGFVTDINTDIPMKFYQDKIFIHLKSPDNIQYAEVEISSSDVLDYRPGLEGDPDRKDAKMVMKGTDGDYKPVLIDTKGTLDEITSFAQKDDIIVVRIDTFYYKRVEFHCPGNIVIWAQLVDPTTVMKSIEKLPEIIRKVRNDPNIKKASAIIEPATFANRICAIGGKGGKKRDIDERIFIELDKENGLYVTSGDKLKGRFFELKPMGMDASALEEVPDQIYNAESMETEGIEDLEGIDAFGYAPRGDTGNKDRTEKKRTDQKTQLDQLLGLEVDDTQYVYLSKEFLIPFTKLKGLSPIVIEVRTDKPIVLQQKPYNGITALLTVAPRIENEGDT